MEYLTAKDAKNGFGRSSVLRRLAPASTSSRAVVSLFTGAGGLDLGLEAAGFKPVLCVELDKDSKATLKRNRPRWKLADPSDIHALEPGEVLRQAELRPRELQLLAGGPPCQPFSKSAYWSNGNGRRLHDPRADTLRAYIQVVEAALPKVLLLENVKGLAYKDKDEGIKLLHSELAEINRRHRTNYHLQEIHLNTAAYGVPQVRERLFLVASIDGRRLELPPPTHGENEGLDRYRTAWDAIGHLDCGRWPPELSPSGRWAALLPSIPEGQNYLWHTPRNRQKGSEPLFGWRTRYWSFLLKLAKNKPSWTIQAQPGPATGPFHWRNRLLSVEELCRIQTFPAGYEIVGRRLSAHRQIGNAVPCAIGELLGLEIRRQMFGEKVRRTLLLIPIGRPDCPPPEVPSHVPKQYLHLRARHEEHPGPGLGPGALRRGQELEEAS
jgi:DNA (cytosine-5)-methyltransferase 1